MKKIKRVVAGLLAIGMVFALAACGGKEQTVTYRIEQDEPATGLKTVDTMTLEAKGDKVQKLIEVLELDMTNVDETQIEATVAGVDIMVETCKAIEGVTCEGGLTDKTYKMTLEVDATGNAVKELADAGILKVDGSTSGISLKATGSALEAVGYTKVE